MPYRHWSFIPNNSEIDRTRTKGYQDKEEDQQKRKNSPGRPTRVSYVPRNRSAEKDYFCAAKIRNSMHISKFLYKNIDYYCYKTYFYY